MVKITTFGSLQNDIKTLAEAGLIAGLKENEVKEVIHSNVYADAVKKHELAAQQIGVRGVPFFVFNHKYAVLGAQSLDTFLEIIEKAWSEFEKENR